MKCPASYIKDRKKARKLVTEVLESPGDYVCLRCGKPQKSYRCLVAHKAGCCNDKGPRLAGEMLAKPQVKVEDDAQDTELSNYITGSVTRVPETSFNNMHGRLEDLRTQDADKYLSKPPNTLGLVRLNYSGSWSLKDAWEAGGWEPRPDQLTWQPYELAAAIQNEVDSVNADRRDYGDEAEADQVNGGGEVAGGLKSKPKNCTVSPTTTATAVTRRLTSQVVSRQPPLITNPQLHRQFLLKLSKIPWTEQIKIKRSFDGIINPKKAKRADSLPEASFKNPAMPAKLDLKQIGKSVKYSKGRTKGPQVKLEATPPFAPVLGTLAGEWEAEHSFVCSVCGIEYDDVLEIMHHKWEMHPHCLVTHVSLKENLRRPPSLLYPQVGPSTIPLEQQVKQEAPSTLACSKCQDSFDSKDDFHAHILVCGGVSPWDRSPSKKRKRKGHGGGLKSTVRMLKKSSQSRDGTDTDEPSPKKRSRPPPRNFSDIPLVPTHNRTTRFKETKEKEAKVLLAKEKKGKRKRKGAKKKETKSNDTFKQDVNSVVTDLVEKVHAHEKKRLRHSLNSTHQDRKDRAERGRLLSSQRSSSTSRAGRSFSPRETGGSRRSSDRPSGLSPADGSAKRGLRNKETRRYTEQSSGESQDETRPEGRSRRRGQQLASAMSPAATPRQPAAVKVPQEIIRTVEGLIDSVLAVVEGTEKLQDSRRARKRVQLSVFSDSDGAVITDHETMTSGRDSVLASPAKRSKKLHRSPSKDKAAAVDADDDKLVEKPEPVEQGLENGFVSGQLPSTRIHKRLHSDLSPRLVPNTELKKRRSVSPGLIIGSPRRSIFPVDVKISAIRRLEAGEPHSLVASDLDISVNCLAKWWLGRKEIWDKFYLLNCEAENPETVPETDNNPERKATAAAATNHNTAGGALRTTSGRRSRSSSSETLADVPLEIKSAALERVLAGESQNAVARDMGIKLSALARWWPNRNNIFGEFKKENLGKVVTDIVHDAEESKLVEGNRKSCENIQENDRDLGTTDNAPYKRSGGVEITNNLPSSQMKSKKKSTKKSSKHKRKKSKKRIGRPRVPSKDSVVVIEEIQQSSSSVKVLELVENNNLTVFNDTTAAAMENQGKIDSGETSIDAEEGSEKPSIERDNERAASCRPRRLSVGTANLASPSSASRLVMPLDVKRQAIRKILSGETQTNVARDLDIPASTVATWWRKKDAILNAPAEEDDTSDTSGQQSTMTDEVSSDSEKTPCAAAPLVPPKSDGQKSIQDSSPQDPVTKARQTPEAAINTNEGKKGLEVPRPDRNSPKKACKESGAAPSFNIALEKETLLKSMKTAFSLNLKEDSTKSSTALHAKDDLQSPKFSTAIKVSDNVDPMCSKSTTAVNGSVEEADSMSCAENLTSAPSFNPIQKSSPAKLPATVSLQPGDIHHPVEQARQIVPDPSPQPQKRRSLEFLANCLMKKALAHTESGDKPVLTKPVSASTQNETRSNGSLSLIADSYLSSEEES